MKYLLQNRHLATILDAASSFGLNQWYIGAGSVCQTVWNIKHGFNPDENINDIDLIYFDSSDLSENAETKVQEMVAREFPHVPQKIEVVNQARVHLWYERDFGIELSPYDCSESAIDSWPTTASSIGVRRGVCNEFEYYAPFGLRDIDEMIVRPNKKLVDQKIYESKANRWKKTWPKLTVVEWNEPYTVTK